MGKTCLPTTAKPHSGDTTVEGSSGTRRTSDPVETGLRRAHARTKPRAAQTGREVPGLPEWRPGQTPARPGRESPTARLLAHVPKETWMDTGTFTGRRPRAQSQGRSGRRRAGSPESGPFWKCPEGRCSALVRAAAERGVGRRASAYSHLGRLPREPPPPEAAASSGAGWGGAGNLSAGQDLGPPPENPSPYPVVPRPGEPPASGRGDACVSRGHRGGEAAPPDAPRGREQTVHVSLTVRSQVCDVGKAKRPADMYIRPAARSRWARGGGRGLGGEDRARGSSVPPFGLRYKLVLAARVCLCFCGTKAVDTGPGRGEVSQSAESGKAAGGAAGRRLLLGALR